MKITLHPSAGKLPVEKLTGVMSFASFDELVKAAVDSKRLFVDTNEYVAGVCIEEYGLLFQIKKFGE